MKIADEIKQKSFVSENQKVFLNILYTNNVISSSQYAILKKEGLTAPQYNVLRILRGQKGESITVNGIIERMLDRQSNASRIVDKLERKGYVTRKKSKKDRRSVDIIIKEEGLKLLKGLDGKLITHDQNWCPLTEEEGIELNRLLDKFRASF